MSQKLDQLIIEFRLNRMQILFDPPSGAPNIANYVECFVIYAIVEAHVMLDNENVQNRGVVSDYDLIDARDNWSDDQWASHFNGLGVRAAGKARYDASGSNDVLKIVLLKVQKGRCWLQGSSSCHSRALLARDAQIDHVIPQTY